MSRIQRDFKTIVASNLIDYSVKIISNNIYNWKILIHAKEPYDNIAELNAIIPLDYPFTAPKIKFISSIFHPNIDKKGDICLDMLKSEWKPTYTMARLIETIISMLSNPNPDDPYNIDAANLYKKDITAYNIQAKYSLMQESESKEVD